MNNPPAFPTPDAEPGFQCTHTGMTLRDYFAAAAIPALWITANDQKSITRDNIVGEAYAIADAMLKAREK